MRSGRHITMPTASTESTDPWMAPRISFSRDFCTKNCSPSSTTDSHSDFEFSMCARRQGCNDDAMLPADELFHEGKLLPLDYAQHIIALEHAVQLTPTVQIRRSPDNYAASSQPSRSNSISPRAPTCTSRWRELFGLKKVHSPEALFLRGRQQGKYAHVLPARRSMDSGPQKQKTSQDAGLNPNTKSKGLFKSSDDSGINYISIGGEAVSKQKNRPKPTETLTSAVEKLVVDKGLDRSSSSSSNNSNSPRPPKKKPKQGKNMRRQHNREEGPSLERWPSYSAGVKVSPVINVPLYYGGAGLRKGSKAVLTHLFNSKKDKAACHFTAHQRYAQRHSYQERI